MAATKENSMINGSRTTKIVVDHNRPMAIYPLSTSCDPLSPLTDAIKVVTPNPLRLNNLPVKTPYGVDSKEGRREAKS